MCLNLAQAQAELTALKAQAERKHRQREALEDEVAALRGARADPEGDTLEL